MGYRDINFRVIEIHRKHSAPTKVRVIRAIVKRDGQVIDLPETLNLIKITKHSRGYVTRAESRR